MAPPPTPAVPEMAPQPDIPPVPAEPRPAWLPPDAPWPVASSDPDTMLTTHALPRAPWWMEDSDRPSMIPIIALGTLGVVILIVVVALHWALP